VAEIDGPDNPLPSIPAFREFTAGIAERCEIGPQTTDAELLGAYPPR
jgi:hypothetical protein